MRFLISLALLLQPFAATGQTNISSVEYSAQMLARPDSYSTEEKQIAEIVKSSMKDNLRASFVLAQKKFISDDIHEMASYWLDVVGYSLKADWDQPERELISFAYLRLAQISQNTAETKKYLNEAAAFDSSYEPNIQLLPPPIVEQFKRACSEQDKVHIQSNHLGAFSFVLINGRKQKIIANVPLVLTSGLQRITLISPTHQPVTRILLSQELANFKPTLQPRQLPSVSSLKPKTEDYIGTTEPFNNQSPSKKDYSFYKKQSFWVGLALTSAALYAIYRQGNTKETPAATHREGL